MLREPQPRWDDTLDTDLDTLAEMELAYIDGDNETELERRIYGMLDE